ncbi:MAG TPA: hypothetical protein VF698_08725 [Thermoanaerobaculia bacterium]|jgi:uncharacterized membrane protein
MLSPLLLLHICGAVVGLLSGAMAMVFRKGSGLHGAAGTVFFVSMLLMSSSGAYIAAFLKPNTLNVVAALLTFYLVSTAWWAARQRTGRTGAFDVTALLLAVSVALLGLSSGFQAANSVKGTKDGMTAAPYFVFGTIALLCSVTDIRVLKSGGAVGARRIARHLWRMSLALLIATLSFYPGQAKLFPRWLRDTNVLLVPHVLLIGAMVFALYRVRGRKRIPTPVNGATTAWTA